MNKKINLLEKKILLDYSIFRIEEARFQQEKPDGGMSEVIRRVSLERGDSACAVVYHKENDTIILVDQFRYPAHEKGPGWLLELPAGIINTSAGESPEESMRRELREEVGYDVKHLKLIHVFYPSPGGSSERVYLFFGKVDESNRVGEGGGISTEGEYIRVMQVATRAALLKADQGEIVDAKTIIGLQWLKIARLTGEL